MELQFVNCDALKQLGRQRVFYCDICSLLVGFRQKVMSQTRTQTHSEFVI